MFSGQRRRQTASLAESDEVRDSACGYLQCRDGGEVGCAGVLSAAADGADLAGLPLVAIRCIIVQSQGRSVHGMFECWASLLR